MKISIITVAYNSAATIRDTIDSVIGQSYENIEYLIIDGASKDNTIDIINEYGAKITKVISEPDKGIYDAMNKGIIEASGDIICFINSDDFFADKFVIGKVVSYFIDNPDVDGVYADLYYVDRNDTSKIVRYWKTGLQKDFVKGWHPAHPTFYVKRKVYERCGMFDLDYKLAADFELMLRFIEKEKISLVYLPEPLIKMRLGGATNKSFVNIRKQNIECMRAFHKNGVSVSCVYYLYRLLPKLKQYFI